MKIDWKSKLTSRKFWAAIIGVITTIMVALKISDLSIQQVVAVVTSVSVLIAYILGEGMVDAARLKSQGENPITQNIYSAIPPEEAALKCHDFNVSTIYTTKPLNSAKAYENAKVAMESISPEDKRKALAQETCERLLNSNLNEESMALLKSLISEDDK